MGDTVGFGILGSGNMATVYGDALTRDIVDAGRLVAVALGSRAEKYASEFGIDAEPSAEALLARTDVDVAVITTPHSTHLPLALAAAEAGKHVYLEKPMALNTAECTQIVEACQRAGVQLTVAKQTRHMQMARRAKEWLDEGLIGDLRIIRPASVTYGAGFAEGNHWSYSEAEGNAFLDWGAHACDATRWFTGSDAVRVYAEMENFDNGQLPDPTAAVTARMSSGAIAQILLCYEIGPSGFGTRRNNQYLLLGSEGSIFWDLDRVELWTGDRERRVWELPSWTLPDFKTRDPRRIGNTAPQVQDFVNAIRDGRAPSVTGDDGRKAIEMCEAATISARTGQAVHLPLVGAGEGAARGASPVATA